MRITEDTQHDILFVIVAAIFFIFSSGMADPAGTVESSDPIITE